ncbi:MAG: ABC transporter ATP-binding protein [Clostridia bacterium]
MMPENGAIQPILLVRGLRTDFHTQGKRVQAVRGVDLTVGAGEILGVVGESGSGKSVTMKSIIQMLPGTAQMRADVIDFGGRTLLGLPEAALCKIRGKEISMIFQDPMTSLNPLKTVGHHLIEVLRRHTLLTKAEASLKAVEMLKQVGVPSPEARMKQYPHEFSGGMRQRVLIAMALSCEPRLLIADEPTTALDVTIQAQILDLIRDLQSQKGMAVVMITHNLGIVASLCHRICVMYGGLILEEGTVDDIFYRAKHPYTQALLRSVPAIDSDEADRLIAIEGQAPSLIDPPPGCPFAPRCPRACPACKANIPEFTNFGEVHRARCLIAVREEERP